MDPPKYVYSLQPPKDLPDDLVGYGECPKDPQWPNGSRIAISFVLLLNDSRQKYSCRVGCWRLLKTMKEYQLPITVCGHAEAFLELLDISKACIRDGHEIANHGLVCHRGTFSLETNEQLSLMVKTSLQKIAEVTGVQPVGSYIGNNCTTKIACIAAQAHQEVGNPMIWSSDAVGDDLPYWADLPQEKHFPDSEKHGLLVFPFPYDVSHLSTYKQYSGVENGTYKNRLINEFNQLYHEGGKVMNISLQPEIVGRAYLTQELREFIEYMKEKESVWVATRKDIALHFRNRFPYIPKSPDSKK